MPWFDLFYSMFFGMIFLFLVLPLIIVIVIILIILWSVKSVDKTPRVEDAGRTISTPYTSSSARRPVEPPTTTIKQPVNSSDVKFCPGCGARVSKEDPFCTTCGKQLKE